MPRKQPRVRRLKAVFASHAAGLLTGLCAGLNTKITMMYDLALAMPRLVPDPLPDYASTGIGVVTGWVFYHYGRAGMAYIMERGRPSESQTIGAGDCIYGGFALVSTALYGGIAADAALDAIGLAGRGGEAISLAASGLSGLFGAYVVLLGSVVHKARLNTPLHRPPAPPRPGI